MSESLAFLCRGPLPLQVQARKAELYATGYEEAAEYVDTANRGLPEGAPYVHFVERRLGAGRVTLVSHWSTGELHPYVARPICGFDFAALIQAGPHDGIPHEYTCPTCGSIVRITPAVIK